MPAAQETGGSRFDYTATTPDTNRQIIPEESTMALTGTWNMTMKSPIGEQKALLTLTESGGALSGSLGSGGDSTPLDGALIDGQSVSFAAKITKPMPITLAFAGKLEGDAITGEVKFGGFGAGPFTATRA